MNWFARRTSAHARFLFMEADGDQLAKIADLVELGKIRPVIDEIFSFRDLRSAMNHLESGHATRKVVVRIGNQ